MLQAEQLTLTYKDGTSTIDAVHDVSLAIGEHQFVGILGPSGSGKSSLLYLLSGLRKPTGGEVYLDDRPYSKMSERAHAAQAMALLADLGLKDMLHRFPYELSGGERQRVAIARAMIHRPRVIFADEPTGLLDRRTGLQVMSLLRSYRDQGSLIAVTHNPEILTEADHVITLRDGHLVRAGERSTRIIREPALKLGPVVAQGE
jgi:putative ABC transport system ATP-binding protein